MSADRISRDEYLNRRRTLMAAMAPGSLALIPGASPQVRNRDIDYVFRQDSDFWYLTGFAEPDTLLVLAPGRDEGEALLFCAAPDEHYELYNGERLGPDGAVAALAVDSAHPVDDLAAVLPKLLEGTETLYVTLGDYPEFDRRLLGWVSSLRARESGGVVAPSEFIGLKKLLHEQRLIKSPAEQRLMGRAADISAAAQVRAMGACGAGMNETQLEAELLYAFMGSGARAPAYPPIVGGGGNACVLHYSANNAPLCDGDLVLVDAGCEYEHYAADLTRTFPVNGRFSDVQRALYEVVLEAQKLAIAACAPGADFNEPHETALRTMVEGLVSLGLLSGTVEDILQAEDHKAFCPHKSSHWLGLDVHDVGGYLVEDQWRKFEPGMVLTVEPGLYIAPGNDSVPAQWRGIGIRIEDDILIAEQGPLVLTDNAPKEIADIEAVTRGV